MKLTMARVWLTILCASNAAVTHADADLTTKARPAEMSPAPLQFCEADITQAILAQNSPINTSGKSAPIRFEKPCQRHPWVRELDQWRTRGMALDTAMQWLVTEPDEDLHPRWGADLADLARMRAAYTLAQAGHLHDARSLWNGLAHRRPHWAEVSFNLGLALHLAGDRERAHQHFMQAAMTCERTACSIEPSLLSEWLARTGGQP